MALEKLTIFVEIRSGKYGSPFPVLFNPSQITLDKSANWTSEATAESDATETQFTYGTPYSLTLDLFFDTYEERTDVRTYTRTVAALVTVQGELHRPPRCRLAWGRHDFNGYQWVLEKLSQRFTLFLPDGTPVRATLGCSFKQWRSAEEEARETKKSSPDVAKTRIVRRGETLSSIAAEEYDDPALWRPIAELNGIHNPRRVAPGQVLAIPPLQPGRR
jgi:nucleoid-associated protein YgaU